MADDWRVYEDAARAVIQNLHQDLGIDSVSDKQTVLGKSGTQWEFDALAFQDNGENFIIIEARRYTTSSLKQKDIATSAFSIGDVGAVGGIVISPLPLQRGAELVAKMSGIKPLRLSPDSTSVDYLAESMSRRFIGVSID